MPEIVLQVDALCGGYGRSQVLFDVSLAVPRIGAVSIVGLNGAGKTTLLRHLMGELRRTSGEVTLDGTSIDAATLPSTITRRGVAYVPQDNPVFSGLTVRENLKLGAMSAPKARRGSYDTALEIFPKLGERLDQVAGTMSGGERKMLAIARALLGEPHLLVMDEPTEGVWAGVVEQIGDRLADLATRMALLVVEQNLGLVLRISDRIVVLDRGVVVVDEARAEMSEERLVPYLTP
jgi:branched-chain amino acid transport system ATP-binding protein